MTLEGPPDGAEWVGEQYRDSLRRQVYTPATRIEGVEIKELKVFGDEGGDFCEITRFDAEGCLASFPGYRPQQISYSLMEPGTIKAWHLHGEQDDLWFLPPSHRLLVGLLDVRKGSGTYRQSMRLAMGAGKAQLLFIPRGVAHGVANIGGTPASILYFVNKAFDAEDPDEYRLPYDLLGADFWTITAG